MRFDTCHKALASALAALSLLATSANASDEMSYTYVQAGGGLIDSKVGSRGDLLEGRLMLGLGDWFFVRADGYERDFSSQNTISTYYAGSVGVHAVVSERVDVLFDVGYANENIEVGGTDEDFDGPMTALSLRGLSPEGAFEAEARYVHRWFDDVNGSTEDSGSFRFEGMWRATDNFGVYAAGTWETENSGNSDGAYAVGLRLSL